MPGVDEVEAVVGVGGRLARMGWRLGVGGNGGTGGGGGATYMGREECDEWAKGAVLMCDEVGLERAKDDGGSGKPGGR